MNNPFINPFQTKGSGVSRNVLASISIWKNVLFALGSFSWGYADLQPCKGIVHLIFHLEVERIPKKTWNLVISSHTLPDTNSKFASWKWMGLEDDPFLYFLFGLFSVAMLVSGKVSKNNEIWWYYEFYSTMVELHMWSLSHVQPTWVWFKR